MPGNFAKVTRERVYNEGAAFDPSLVLTQMIETGLMNREYLFNSPHVKYRKIMTDWVF